MAVPHTPGPWARTAGERFKHDHSAGVTDSEGYYIACALDQNRYDRDEEVEANAHLIASAPDLLAACASFLSAWDSNAYNAEELRVAFQEHGIVDDMRAALAKARGESS